MSETEQTAEAVAEEPVAEETAAVAEAAEVAPAQDEPAAEADAAVEEPVAEEPVAEADAPAEEPEVEEAVADAPVAFGRPRRSPGQDPPLRARPPHGRDLERAHGLPRAAHAQRPGVRPPALPDRRAARAGPEGAQPAQGLQEGLQGLSPSRGARRGGRQPASAASTIRSISRKPGSHTAGSSRSTPSAPSSSVGVFEPPADRKPM